MLSFPTKSRVTLSALIVALSFAAASLPLAAALPVFAGTGTGEVMAGRIWPDNLESKNGVNISVLTSFMTSTRTANSTGAAVLIVPSGVPTQGVNVPLHLQLWLGEHGVNAFVVKYSSSSNDKASALADVNRAMQFLRSHAADFNISPSRIGLLGLGDGAALAADAAYNHQVAANPDATDPVEKVASRPDFMALIWGSAAPAAGAAIPPATFLVGSSRAADGQSGMIDLWSQLRAARVPVDAHFFAAAPPDSGLGGDNPSLSSWPESFLTWAKFMGFLSDGPRVPLKGVVTIDGRTLPHGYLILTPVDFVGAGPIAAQILNSTANVPMGQFTVPANLGAVPGRYRVDVRENMTRWISNSFTGSLAPMRANNEEQAWFGHHRPLAPSLPDQLSFTKVRPSDKDDYIVEIKPDAAANLDLNIAVFSSETPPPAVTVTDADAARAGFYRPQQNPGQLAYVEQLKAHPPGPVPGIPEPILLWPEGAPGALPDANGAFTDEDKPAIYAFPAPAAGNTGAAVLVLPGGAFTNRGMDNEGVQIAKFLNRHGIAGFVLRYRIGPNYPNRTTSTLDAHRAMQYLRAHAADFKISPDRIGAIGFSAGSELEGDAFFNSVLPGDPAAADPLDRVTTRSNFNILIYGGRNLTPAVAAVSPPTFLFNTLEDSGHLAPELNVFNALRAAGVPAEAHWYQVGPHGTSMSLGDPQLGQWPELMVKWLKTGGWLQESKPATPAKVP
jgi:acetyl esterase/lipase